MLKRDPKGRFVEEGVFVRHHRFHSGDTQTHEPLTKDQYKQVLVLQQEMPVLVMRNRKEQKTWWMFEDEFFWENDGYTADQVKILILDMRQKKQRAVDRAALRVAGQEPGRREQIADDVKTYVWRRDGGRCVKCGSQDKLEFDHIIPVSMGGSNTARNIQLLCETCNRAKGGTLA